MRRPCVLAAWLALAAGAATVLAQDRLTVVEVRPARHALAADEQGRISVTFDREVLASSLDSTTFWAFGRWSGPAAGRLTLGDGGATATLVPDRRFSAGEMVTVFLSNRLQAVDGSTLRDAGYSFQFWIRSRGTGLDFSEIDRFSTRSSPEVSTRAYGGFGSDLDGDGHLDLTIVNEDTNDLRTFLNRGDRSGLFDDFLRPTSATGAVPSPSEPSDFDRDGSVDVVVANTRDDSVSVLLGNGDGTFAAASDLAVGGEPRGVTVLDADGDGDVDIAATSFAAGQVAVLVNDGAGGFAAARTFGTGGGERAIAAADMNDDGILDLVVGDLTAGVVRVYAGDGAAGFDLVATRSSGGEVWMLVLGDVDGNGSEDVAVVNSASDNAAILLGDGSGGLSGPRTVATDPFPLATDLADLDGDGDLDWVTSSFFGDWTVFENDGKGAFSRRRSFDAPQAASCSLPMDLDGDGVLDLVLIDELEDEIVLMLGRSLILAAGFEGGNTGEWSAARGAVAVVTPGLARTTRALEVTVDGTASRSWVETRRPAAERNLTIDLLLDPRRVDLGAAPVEILRTGSGRGEAVVRLERAGERYRVVLLARSRGGMRRVGSTPIRAAGAVRLRVEWASASGRATADGFAALSKNGRRRAVAGDLDNHGKTIGRVRLGLPGGSRGAVGGSFVVDEVTVSR